MIYIKTQIFLTSFDLGTVHEGYCLLQFEYLYKLSYLTSNNLVSSVNIGYYVVVQEYQHAFGRLK